jgi:demethylmenaquinone methyltransferase/2-methoxy-6-polyprenyl-1,4-benzoquinol methylase
LLSFYQDVFWRRFAAKKIRRGRTCRFLDVATGTADLAIEEVLHHAGCFVVAMDLMGEMIALGTEKLQKRNLLRRACLLRADAVDMPFPSETFDAASIAFGIRNIPDKIKALREMGRVVVPGGQVLVLEMTRPDHRLFLRLYRFYLRTAMPLAARAFTPNPGAYRYLADSILHFPSPSDFSDMMRKAGLSPVESYSLTFGITHLFVGNKQGETGQ